MATQFISKTIRKLPEPERIDDVYAVTAPRPSSLKINKSSLAPFAASSRRPMTEANFEVTPSPGHYDIATTLHTKQNMGTTFKSTQPRIPSTLDADGGFNAPPPGTYVLKSTIKNGRPKQYARPSQDATESLIPRSVSVPTIPTKAQALGYEVQANGVLRKSSETFVGFKGTPDDAPGPFDYDPQRPKRDNGRAATLKGAGRSNLNRAAEKEAESKPGPGSYRVKSVFDLEDDNEDSFVIKLNNARRKEHSIFASKTNKNLFMKDVEKNIDEPGPGYYDLPVAINVPSPKPVNQQFFTSKEQRFKPSTSRSMKVNTAPGMYTLPSSTEMQKFNVLKKKKMTSRSAWAQTISFDSTEGRTVKQFECNDVPPPTAYQPKMTMADRIPPEMRTGGGFGGKDIRFKIPKAYSATTEAQKRAKELNDEITPYLEGRHNIGAKTAMAKKPTFTSNFAPNSEERFKPPKTPPGPAPTAFNTAPSWKTGTCQMAPDFFDPSKKRVEVRPGPGDYVLSKPQKFVNRKNIMVSSSTRDLKQFLVNKSNAPGPGRYDPEPVYNNMIKRSHNVLLSGMY